MPAHFYVHLIESPSPDELRDGVTEGKALCSFLDIAGIPYAYNLVVDLDQFHIAMTDKIDEATDAFRKVPILHLSTLGSERGIQLTNQNELLWSELAEYIRLIHGGLGVCISGCFGLYGAKMAEVTDIPYGWIASSGCEIEVPDVALAYAIFYRRLYCGIDDIASLLRAIRVASRISDFNIRNTKRIQAAYLQDRIDGIAKRSSQKRREELIEKICERIREERHEEYIDKIIAKDRTKRVQETIEKVLARKREESRREKHQIQRTRIGKARNQPAIWRDRIVTDPQILAGKPTVKGTRISVELIIDLLEGGRTADDIMWNYPHITKEDIEACQQYKATGAKLSNITLDGFDTVINGKSHENTGR